MNESIRKKKEMMNVIGKILKYGGFATVLGIMLWSMGMVGIASGSHNYVLDNEILYAVILIPTFLIFVNKLWGIIGVSISLILSSAFEIIGYYASGSEVMGASNTMAYIMGTRMTIILIAALIVMLIGILIEK